MLLKRAFDILASFFGLLVLWPVLLVVAILIKLKMGAGPVFFTQKRVGRHGKLFTLVKFRTMSVGHGGSSVSVKGESRITPLGATLRKYKLDELPTPKTSAVGQSNPKPPSISFFPWLRPGTPFPPAPTCMPKPGQLSTAAHCGPANTPQIPV
jgi:hypothetical protein